MKRSFGATAWLMALVVTAAPTAVAQIEPGRIYTGREQISNPATGLTLTIPLGWSGRLSPDGESFLLESEVGGAEAQQESMREFAFSLGVQEQNQQVPGAAQAAAGNDEWEPYLRGRYLARYFTRTGYTESTELWLCSNGEFYYDSQGGGFGGGASGAVQSRDQGRWSATGAGKTGTLLLAWSSGQQTRLDLMYDYENDRLYVNGDRMLRGNNERCQ